jgi:hypothetical protein
MVSGNLPETVPSMKQGQSTVPSWYRNHPVPLLMLLRWTECGPDVDLKASSGMTPRWRSPARVAAVGRPVLISLGNSERLSDTWRTPDMLVRGLY